VADHTYQVVFRYLRPYTDSTFVIADTKEDAENYLYTKLHDLPGLEVVEINQANPDVVNSIDRGVTH